MFAVLYIPRFSLQAVLRSEPAAWESSVALLNDSKTPAVSQATEKALAAGVEIGMPSTQALARCRGILFRLRQPAQEERAQQILIECAYSFAAYIESTAPGICTMDLRGLPQPEQAGGWDDFAWKIVARLNEFDLRAQVGLAATPGLALQAAQAATPVLRIHDPASFWQRLPIRNIAAPPEILSLLHRWGITTVADFLKLGKDRISERLGAEGVQLFENASADVMRPLVLTAPAPVYEEYYEYEQEVETLEPLLFMLRRFIDQLTRRVGLAGRVVEQLHLKLHLTSGENYERSFRIPAPTADVEVLFRMAHNHLETIRTASPIRALTLQVTPCAPGNLQFELFESTVRDPNRFFETIGALSALVGSNRVGTPAVRPTHRPDDFEMRPVSLQRDQIPGPAPSSRGLVLRRFRPPVEIEVQLREHQPVSLRGARISGPVIAAKGPWRTSGNWWENFWSREEWDVQTSRGLYRLFRDGEKWFLEGVYD